MKHIQLVVAMAIVLGVITKAQAASTVITFEDITVTYGNSPLYGTANLNDGYGGISGWNAIGVGWGIPANEIGDGIGRHWFYGSSDGQLSFDNAPVVFEGTYYKSYAADWQNPITSISLFYQGNLVHSILDPLAASGLVWVASGYSGLVDRIDFRGGGEGFAIDNLTYTQANLSPVPIPSALPLFLSALSLAGVVSRRRKRQK
ncbi:hypothetical protein MTYM_00079 [Methylococcales bacterium]|nr:hypothetical protein MTYM_00079 [Methylococcales bacterium]